MTNQEFYNELTTVIEQNKHVSLSLKQFLMNTLSQLQAHKAGLTPQAFISLVEKSFGENKSIDLDLGQALYKPSMDKTPNTYDACASTLIYQIGELNELEASGGLEKSFTDFGAVSSSHRTWNNLHVPSYLECGAAWQVDYYGEDFEFDADWSDLIQLFEMCRLYE